MIPKGDKQAARERAMRARRREQEGAVPAVAPDLAGRLVALEFEGGRLLHLGLPSELPTALCRRDGDGRPVRPASELLASQVCRGCRSAAGALVLVRNPDADGEAVESLVAGDHFKVPKISAIISKRFRERVLAGDLPALVFPGPPASCPVVPGEVHLLSENVWIITGAITRTRKGEYRIAYVVTDDRPVLIRRTPPMHEPPDLDPRGKPRRLTPAEEATTRIASNYTQDPRQAVPMTAPEVDIEYRRVLDVRKRTREAERRKEAAPMEGAEQNVKAATGEMRELAKRAAKMGLDPVEVLAPVLRSIKDAHASLSDEGERDDPPLAA